MHVCRDRYRYMNRHSNQHIYVHTRMQNFAATRHGRNLRPASRCGPPSFNHHECERIKHLSAELRRDAGSHRHEARTTCFHRWAASCQSAGMASSRDGSWALRNSCTTFSIGFSLHGRTPRRRCLNGCLGSRDLRRRLSWPVASSILQGYDGA